MAQVGYLELIRSNRNFRRLWLGGITSGLGDWINTIALYTLIRQLTGSPLALGLVFLTKMVPFALASPFAGLITDRFNRRRLMIGTDLARAVVVLGFLLVDEVREVPLLYALTAVQLAITAVFIPARSASIPNVTSKGELLTANALSAVTWSTLLAVGAALGGLLTEGVGVRGVFVFNSLSYCVSAWLIFRTVIPQSAAEVGDGSLRSVLAEVGDGWRHMVRDPRIGRIALTKASWSLGGGALVYMLALVGEEFIPGAPALGIGLLYAVRGIGTGIGPVAARALVPDERHWAALLGLGLVASGLGYVSAGVLTWSWWLLPCVLWAHVPSGANWVMSTVMLQRRTADAFRGRVFATEWLLVALVNSVSILAASLLLESGLLSLRAAIVGFAALMAVTGLLWLALIAPREAAAYQPRT